MVAKCSNPPCNRQFRSLSKGRLFLLPSPVDSELMWKVDRLADHCYWLCPECSQDYTIARVGGELLFSKKESAPSQPRPEPVYPAVESVFPLVLEPITKILAGCIRS
jgi:hypothetical protein